MLVELAVAGQCGGIVRHDVRDFAGVEKLRLRVFTPAEFLLEMRCEMSTLSLRLPESIHRKLSEVAEREGVSMNQLISSAVAEKLAALMTEEYLHERARRASAEKFDAVLDRIPDAPPSAGDELPAGHKKLAKGAGRGDKATEPTRVQPRGARRVTRG